MNSMYEMYARRNDLYEELVAHEDYESNLKRFLLGAFDFSNKTVCELGVGTGRVTKLYVDAILKADVFDISGHMLSRAKENLLPYSSKIEYAILDNKEASSIEGRYDFLIEGWSFGHVISQEKEYEFWIDKLIEDCKRLGRTNIWIETMGTCVDEPTAPTEKLRDFYACLRRNGFAETVLSTDYKFDDFRQAANILGSFFGQEMENKIIEKKESVITEYTGIWTFAG